jgi:hypothetical protein
VHPDLFVALHEKGQVTVLRTPLGRNDRKFTSIRYDPGPQMPTNEVRRMRQSVSPFSLPARRAALLAIAAVFGLVSAAVPASTPLEPAQQIGAANIEARDIRVGRAADGRYLLAWSGEDSIFFQRHAANGQPLGAVTVIGPAEVGTAFPRIQLDSNAAGDFVLRWESIDGLRIRSYAANGSLRAAFLHSDDPAGLQTYDVAIDDGGNLLVATRVVRGVRVPLIGYSDIRFAQTTVSAQRYTASGTPVGLATRIFTSLTDPGLQYRGLSTAPPAAVFTPGGAALVVWETEDGIGPRGVFGRRLTANGRVDGLAFRVDGREAAGANRPSVETDAAGNVLIAWTQPHPQGSNSFSGEDVFVRRYDTAGRSGPIVEINGDLATSPDIDLAVNRAGDAVLIWPSTPSAFCCQPAQLTAQRLDRSGQPAGASILVAGNFVDEPQVDIADDGSFVAVWSQGLFSSERVFARRYSAP